MVKIIGRSLLPEYPNIDGVVNLNHLRGCGIVISAPTVVVSIRTIHNITLSPNFGGEVIVAGLGCEKLQPQRLQKGAEDVQNIPVDRANIVRLQDGQYADLKPMVDNTLQAVVHHLEKFNQTSMSPARLPDWQWTCTTVAATRSPALPLTPLLAILLTCWCAVAQR